MKINFSKLKTKSGVPLWIFSSSRYNSVALGVLVKCGTRDEIWPQEAGIAHALEHMHFQGTENFPSSLEISGHIEEIGGDINAWTNGEATFYHVRVPVGHAERAVRIISEQLNKSVFPEEKILVEMKNIIQEIHRSNDDPQGYLGTLNDRFVYNNHPFSKDVLGLENSVLAFAKKDFQSFKKRYYHSSNYTFIVVGNIAENEALELFDKYFEEKSEIRANNRRNQKVIIRPERQLIEKKELQQLHISLSALIGKSKDKSSFYLDCFSTMISGGMSFPLFQEVRDKLGLCYQIGAGVASGSDAGMFNIYIGTDHKRYKEAIDATLGVIKKYKSDASLLDKVKNLQMGCIMLSFENTARILSSAVSNIVLLGAPKLEEMQKQIKEVKIENITEVVEKYLNPELIFTVMLAPKDFEIG